MQRSHSTTASPRSGEEHHGTTDASVAVVRLAAERPLGATTFRGRLERFLLVLTKRGVWIYLLFALGALALAQLETDRWWLATLLMSGPTWLGLLPLAIFVPLAALFRARLLVPLLVAAILYTCGVLGFCVAWPWERTAHAADDGLIMLSCNLRGGNLDSELLGEVIRRRNIKLVTLQHADPTVELAFPEEWEVLRRDHLLIASEYPFTSEQSWQPETTHQGNSGVRSAVLNVIVQHPTSPIALANIQLSSPFPRTGQREPKVTPDRLSFADRVQRQCFFRSEESKVVSAWLQEQAEPIELIAGSLNMTVESRIYRRWWRGYENAFSRVGWGLGWTRQASFGNVLFGTRCDHVLLGDRYDLVRCDVGPNLGPAHLPLIVELTIEK